MIVAVAALALAPAPSHACSVPTFGTGKGLPYHTYLAPHPATVLIYDDPTAAVGRRDPEELYSGLRAAGHTIVAVHDLDALRSAVDRDSYDLVIVPLASGGEIAAQVTANAPGMPVLPVVEKSRRRAPELRERFAAYVVDDADLGAYLRAIDRTLAQRRP